MNEKENRHLIELSELLMTKIMNKEITICETCDNIFDYVPQRIYCDECRRERKKAYKRKYYEKNHEKERAAQRKYYEENREKINARRRMNSEKIAEYQCKYHEKNREKILARQRKYYAMRKKRNVK